MAKGAVIVRILSQFSNKGIKAAQKDFAKMQKQFDGFATKAAKTVGLAAVAAGALAVKLGKDSVEAAVTAQAEQNRLARLLINTNGATKEQVSLLLQQADALERVGVVSSGNVNVVQAQLATFDLTAASIQRLTPAILDYVTAEKGAAASAQDFKTLTNGLAQALQGNFSSLTKTGFILDQTTKDQIKFGTESQRSAALVKVLNSTYKDFNKNLRNTPEGRMIVLGNAFNKFKETLGSYLLPGVIAFAEILQKQIIPKLQEWVEANGAKFAQAFQNGISYAIAFGKAVYAVFSFVSRNIKVFALMGQTIVAAFVGIKTAMAAQALINTIVKLIEFMNKLRKMSLLAAAAEALATGGLSVAAAAAGTAAFLVAMKAMDVMVNKLSKSVDVSNSKIEAFKFDLKGLDFSGNFSGIDKWTKSTEKLTEAQKEQAKAMIMLERLRKKFGIKPDSKDPITLEAIRLNMLKQAKLGLSSPTISLAASAGANGSIQSPTTGNGTSVTVNVAGSVVSEADLLTQIQNGLATIARRGGGDFRTTAQVA